MKDKQYKSFIFRESWWQNMKNLPTNARAEVCDAVCRYVFEGVEPTFDPMSATSMAVRFILTDLEYDKQKYETIKEKRIAAGRRGAEVTNSKKTAKSANADFVEDNPNKIKDGEQQNSAKSANADFARHNVNDNVNVDVNGLNNNNDNDFFSLPAFAGKKEKIIFDFSLILLSEGRPNAYKEAKEAYNYNDATGWETEKTDKNGNVTKKRIRNQLAWMQAGWQRHNEQLFAPAQGMIMQSILQEYPAPMYADYINDFRGIRDEGENIAFLFSRKFTAESFMNTFKNTHDYPQFRQAVIKHIKQNYPNANSLFSRVF